MSHSKYTKKGHSLYIDNWNPSAKRFINTCIICGRTGYSPAVDEADFVCSMEREAIRRELLKTLVAPLALDTYSRCTDCARRLDRQ